MDIFMKKTFLLEDLDCAHCAGKIEEDIANMEGVHSCSVNFLTQKMVLDIAEEDLKIIVKQAKKIIKKYEPDVSLVEQ